VTEDQVISAGLAIDQGKIVGVAKDVNLPKGEETIDCRGNFVMPGVIDPHVHFGAWFPFQEDCCTESQAAAIGGTTTVLHHLIDTGSYLDLFKEHRKIVEEKSLIDISFHFAIMTETHLKQLKKYCKLGVTSFKFFMAYRGEEGKQIGIIAADDGLLYEGFQKIKQLDHAIPLIHAENVEIAYRLKAKLRKEKRKDLAAWSEARPNFCEEENIIRAAFLAKIAHSSLYVVHVSAAESVNAIHRLKGSMNIFAETTPHYLTLTNKQDLRELGKVAPPLRGPTSREKLWWGIQKGVIDTIGTDHVPVTQEKKKGDIWTAPPGLPGIGLILPIMISRGVKTNRISLEKVVEVCSYNTAKIFGLYPKKGTLRVGADADLVVVDLNKKMKFTSDILPSVADFSAYEGMMLQGWPTLTMLRGNIVAENGDIVNNPGLGEYIARGTGRELW
jgi:dihydropyrimidinase